MCVCAGEGAADRADGGAEEERGVSERSPSLREEMQRADVPGLLTSQCPAPLPTDVLLVLCSVCFIGSPRLPAVGGGQEDSAEDAGADR